ncbi:copia protein [Tanacetum coccineum]
MDLSDPVDTPMVDRLKLDEDLMGFSWTKLDLEECWLPQCTLHLIYQTFVFAGVHQCARYLAKITKKHLEATYADVDHAGCQDSRRSTSGSAQFLGDRLVSWSSKKQRSTAISTTEAEYIAMSGFLAQILWDVRSQLKVYGFIYKDGKVRSKCENKGIVPTEMELVLEYTQQGASHEVSDHLKMEMEMEIPSVKASANSDIIFFFTSAQDGNKLLDDERLSLADDLKKAHDQNQNKSK